MITYGPWRRLVAVGCAAAAGALLLSSCSTTRPHVTVAKPPAAGVAGGPAGPGVTGVAAVPGPRQTTKALAGGSSSGPVAGGAPIVGGTQAQPSGGGPGSPAVQAAGGDVKIGFHVIKPANYSQAGGKAGSTGDAKASVAAVVKWVNAHGGIAGRRVVSVVYETDATTAQYTSEAQAMCTALTEDAHVLAAVSVASSIADPSGCFAAHKTPFISQERWTYTPQQLKSLGNYLYLLRAPQADHWGSAYVDGLASQGFFAHTGKLGVITYDTGEYSYLVDRVIAPRLAAHGVQIVDQAKAGAFENAGSLGAIGTVMGNAILRFRSEGITKVMFAEAGGVLPFMFMPEAEGQGYRPRYGLQSLSDPSFLASGQVPAAQLVNSVGIGWEPVDDVPQQEIQTSLPASSQCIKVARDAGTDLELGYCDAIFFIKAALDRALTVTAEGLQRSVESLGTSYASALTFSTRFGPDRHDGPNAFRALVYTLSCGCYRYSGPSQAMP